MTTPDARPGRSLSGNVEAAAPLPVNDVEPLRPDDHEHRRAGVEPALHGFDEKGQLAGVIDNAFYYGVAEQHGLHAHLPASARTRNMIGATA